MDLVLGVLVNGVLMGAVYALIAFGLTIIFGVMRVVNFAHGEMVVIGMYAGYFLVGSLRLASAAGSARSDSCCCSLSAICCSSIWYSISSTGRRMCSSSYSSRWLS